MTLPIDQDYGDSQTALRELEKKILWLASWTIHNANHIRPNLDGLKVGGHQASSASMVASTTCSTRTPLPYGTLTLRPSPSCADEMPSES